MIEISQGTHGSGPLVSIIMATYNRSNILAYTIQSVLWSTFEDWELIVMGDACTDDTERVVAAFEDRRVSFINLERNFGEQSGPNNEGFLRSRGRYIAYLNHDDLWLPDHLESLLRRIGETGADLVYALASNIDRSGEAHLVGATPTGRYEPYVLVPASCWLLRRELIEEMGPWKFARQCYVAPSQEFLFRAWRAGKDLRLSPRLTVCLIPAGSRVGSYSRRDSHEHKYYFERIANEADFRENELTAIASQLAPRGSGLEVTRWFKRGLFHIFIRLCMKLNLHPWSVIYFLRDPRRGAMVERRRRSRGLEPLGRGREEV